MLLYRKDNSALDCLCRYDVYLSHLYISRRSKAKEMHIATHSPTSLLTMYRNFNLFPFQPSGICTFYIQYFLIDPFGLVLRSTHSWINTIARKPFLTSAVKVLTWLFATTTKICTNAWSKQDRSLSSSSPSYFYFSWMHHTSLHKER